MLTRGKRGTGVVPDAGMSQAQIVTAYVACTATESGQPCPAGCPLHPPAPREGPAASKLRCQIDAGHLLQEAMLRRWYLCGRRDVVGLVRSVVCKVGKSERVGEG
jgi:hypothetical protein